jgi:hypothetical protein
MKTTDKLAVDKDGNLVPTGIKTSSVEDFTQLNDFSNVEITNDEIILQPLPDKEVVTTSGIILPGKKAELLMIVAQAKPDSKYKRGQVVALNPQWFQQGIFKDYVDNKECTIVPEASIRYVYKNYDLSNWKSDNK